MTRGAGEPLRIASLVKQVPLAETFRLERGRLVRRGVGLEMNAYCRRAVAQGVTLAGDTGGTCTAVTLGPPGAEDVLREAVAWGAGSGLHVCDPAFAGSDTLATARALAAALRAGGPFDLVLVGRNSIDGETGQVGPEVAALLDLPFACGVRRLEDGGIRLRLELEHDDGTQEVEIGLPAVLSVAERLCDPCKVDPEGRAAVPAARIRRITAGDLGPGPWGEAGSPTVVGHTRPMEHERSMLVLRGPVVAQVQAAVHELTRRGALTGARRRHGRRSTGTGSTVRASTEPRGTMTGRPGSSPSSRSPAGLRWWASFSVPRPGWPARWAPPCTRSAPAPRRPGPCPPPAPTSPSRWTGRASPRTSPTRWSPTCRRRRPWAVLAPSTAFGREVAGRAAAATASGLVGDAIALSVREGALVAAKPAFAGALVADITCRSAIQMVTVRPGVLPAPAPRQRPTPAESPAESPAVTRAVGTRGRLRVLAERRDDDVETLARAEVVIGVGTGVRPEEYALLSPLAEMLGAELAATRKVTDRGWAPRSRQVGLTGRSIAPRLYVALGLSGKFNHMVGVRSAGTVLALNEDPGAPVFEHCDVGIVGDWHLAVPLLQEALRRGATRHDATAVS